MAHKANKIVTASSSKKGKKSKHHVHHMTIEKANNGYTAESHFQPNDPEDGTYMPSERHVFEGDTAHKDLSDHVMNQFGAGMAPAAGAGDGTGDGAAEPDGDEADED